MSRLATPIANAVEIPPLPPLSRDEILALMRDSRDASPIIREWCKVTRIMISMIDVLGEEHNQEAMRDIKDSLVLDLEEFLKSQEIVRDIIDFLGLDLDEFLKGVAYAKAADPLFDPPSEADSLDFVYDISSAGTIEPEFEVQLGKLGEQWLDNGDPDWSVPSKEELQQEELAFT